MRWSLSLPRPIRPYFSGCEHDSTGRVTRIEDRGEIHRGRETIERSSRMVMKNHHHKSTRRFFVDPRLGRRHRFCSKLLCAYASRVYSRKKWLKRNGGKGYFTGKIVRLKNRERVNRWRADNPGYWHRKHQPKAMLYPKIALSKKLVAMFRTVSLQDTIDTRLALEIAFAIMSRALRYKTR